jgi:hypothetical protein
MRGRKNGNGEESRDGLQTKSAGVQAGAKSKRRGKGASDQWQRRNNEELERQRPVQVRAGKGLTQKEAKHEKRERDQHARGEAGVREGRKQQGQERERERSDGGRGQNRGSIVGQRPVEQQEDERRRRLQTSAQQQSQSGKPGSRIGQSVLNQYNRGVLRNPVVRQ